MENSTWFKLHIEMKSQIKLKCHITISGNFLTS